MNIGIIGATGIVGQELLSLLDNNHLNIPINNIRLFASKKSVGKIISIYENNIIIEEINDFSNIDVVIFCTSAKISEKYIHLAIKSGCIVIDNSSKYRMYNNIPLVIPEINSNLIKNNKLITNPNCCATMLCMVLNPLKKYNIKRVIVNTYQSASGAGKKGMNELIQQVTDYNTTKLNTTFFGRQYLFNAFSHDSNINELNGYNDEELKLIEETKKILNCEFKMTATCIRIPVLRSHCLSVNIEFDQSIESYVIKNLLNKCMGISIVDDRINNKFPEPIDCEKNLNIYVGRIRNDMSDIENKTINLFIAGDQLLKGASLNNYQILEKIWLNMN